MPLSPETDAEQLARQISARPIEWKAAADFLMRKDLLSLALGRYELTDTGTYANVQEYKTKLSSQYEAHRAYIDIQVVLDGKELIYVSPLDKLSGGHQDYDYDRDIEFWAESSSSRPIVAESSNWAVFFPADAHMPCLAVDSPSEIRKVVVKIPFAPSL